MRFQMSKLKFNSFRKQSKINSYINRNSILAYQLEAPNTATNGYHDDYHNKTTSKVSV